MYYHKLGDLPRKRHTIFRRDNGELFREQLMGLAGFSGISSLLYKHRLPTATLRMEVVRTEPLPEESESKTIACQHFKTAQLPADESLIHARAALLSNSQVSVSVSTLPPNSLFRNASHHELYFIEEGRGILESEFGNLKFVPGDYVSIPKGITYHWRFESLARYLLVQSLEPMRFPSRYLNSMGQFLEHSPVCERDIRVPDELIPRVEEGSFKVLVHRNGAYFEQILAHHPFDTVGWDGCLYPFAISIHDFEPIVGRLHMPPPVHQMFESTHFVVCNFVPRLFDFHPEAIPAPYFHSNIDSDEVIYYVEGNFMSRRGVEKGSITLHPAGLPHGPQPGKTEESVGKKATSELAVMIDTFQPLMVTQRAESVAQADYVESWL
ncbi:homogentisate 1,2-dioxygenase, partial [bacterium]|nr:homogentisate 1,2-dioxygenase [bacterium]